MKKLICVVLATITLAGTVRADEGMWMLPLLQKMNANAMKDLGCKLSPKEIYDINNSSLKDAIVQFGGGCTGEIISSNGLLITNHHCGYANIQKLSSVEHDYLKNGYWASNHAEELPCEGLSVTFLQSMEDVTHVINKAEEKAKKKYKNEDNKDELVNKAVEEAIDKLISKIQKDNPYCNVELESFYNSNVYYVIISKEYKDIRFVGAPPSSIGKFGADTDNWMWPRHTGDFSMFRVYADENNNPADYSPENVPYRLNNPLKISLGGIKEGDFTMIMGYPGRTTRFQTSPELKQQIELNDIRIAARTTRQNVLLEDMLADPKIKIQYASKYSRSSNAWKKWQGMKIAFDKLDIIGRAQKEEADFSAWVKSDKKRELKYGKALETLEKAVTSYTDVAKAYTLASESINTIEISSFAIKLNRFTKRDVRKGKDTLQALYDSYNTILPLYKDYSAGTDRKVCKAMLKFYRDHAKTEDQVLNLSDKEIDSYVDSIFDNSIFTSAETLKAAIDERGIGVLDDPACKMSVLLTDKIMELYVANMNASDGIPEARQLYTAGLLEWKDGEPSYPDANFTMRLTYGTVKGYSPKDAVIYRYYTTLDGVMEKEDPDNWEFVVPGKLKELWQNKDFGDYAMEDGKMPVAFLSNNDITGGNSGSPIMNDKGELIGLAFDGNWESMSSDVMFEPDLQRCINVDIRYVLFIVEKFGGAKWLIDEMEIVK